MALFQGNIFPKTLGYQTQVYVSLPNDGHRYSKPGPERTLILLHGVSDNASGWVRYGLADEMAEKYNIAVVMPEGLKSFWLDMKYGGQYTQYLTGELPQLMGEMFRVPADAGHLMIAGLSMGGYGSLHAAMTDPEAFCAVGSFSGVTDIRDFFGRAEELGSSSDCGANFAQEIKAVTGDVQTVEEKDDLFFLAGELARRTKRPYIYLACGTEDELVYPQNTKFVGALQERGIAADAEFWSGVHDWIFWRRALDRFLEHTMGVPEKDNVFGGIPAYKKENSRMSGKEN